MTAYYCCVLVCVCVVGWAGYLCGYSAYLEGVVLVGLLLVGVGGGCVVCVGLVVGEGESEVDLGLLAGEVVGGLVY